MADPQVLSYIKDQLAQGVQKDAISVALKANGWTDQDVAEAFQQIAPAPTPAPPQSATAPQTGSKKSFYTIIVLVIIVAATIGTWFYRDQIQEMFSKSGADETPESAKTELENFKSFQQSKLEFSLMYPDEWTTTEIRGVDTMLGGLNVYPPNAVLSGTLPGEMNRPDKIQDQIITINGFPILSGTEEVADLFSDDTRITLFADDFTGIVNAPLTVSTIKAPQGTIALDYTISSLKIKGTFVLVAMKDRTTKFNTVFIVDYRTKEGRYSAKLFEDILNSVEFSKNRYEPISLNSSKKPGEKINSAPTREKIEQAYSDQTIEVWMNNYVRNPILELDSYNVCSGGLVNTSLDADLRKGVEGIMKEKKATTQKEAGFLCFSDKTNYALSIALRTQGDALCIDSSGYHGKGVAQKNKTCLQLNPSSAEEDDLLIPTTPTKKTSSTNLTSYQHPSGLYSFSFPKNWTLSETLAGSVFSDLGKIEQITPQNYTTLDHELGIYVVTKDPVAQAKAMAEYLGKKYTEEDIVISGIKSKRIPYNETRAKSDSYAIPLGPNKFMVIAVTARDGSDDWISKGYEAVKTMSIDPKKIAGHPIQEY